MTAASFTPASYDQAADGFLRQWEAATGNSAAVKAAAPPRRFGDVRRSGGGLPVCAAGWGRGR